MKTFQSAVVRSGLLSRAWLEEFLRAAPELRENDEALAAQLVGLGLLTEYQTQKLLKGVSRGLMLGPFQILHPLGKGGNSKVFLARDTRDQQLRALKILPPRKAEHERLLLRFQREMQLSQQLSHPHICRTQEVGVSEDDVHYIAMEYIRGLSLLQRVVQDGPMSLPQAARFFAQVALALDYAHSRSVIHRDLKPSNIMITEHGHAKILDFGLAMILGEDADAEIIGGEGYAVGTWDYMAPEQAVDAARADGRADIYALACSLYFALSTSPPFPGGTTLEKIRKHRFEEPVALTNLVPSLPPAFWTFLARLLSKRPEDRIQTAAEVRQMLLRWEGSQPDQSLDLAAAPRPSAPLPPASVTITSTSTSRPALPSSNGRAFDVRGANSLPLWVIYALVGGAFVGILLFAWLLAR